MTEGERVLSADEVERLRAETPGCAHRIHLNNAGAGLMPRCVLAAVERHLELEAEIGGYEAAAERQAEVAAAYAAVGALIGAPAANVAFVENATAAVAQALSAIPFAPGDVLLTTRDDYVSNQIMYLSLARRLGIEVVRAPDAAEGGTDVDALEELIAARRPRLVSVTWVPTNSGLVQPAAAIGELCRRHEVPYLLDACQAVGQLPVDVATLGCDFLAATSRKFLRGPRGVGFLYASDRVLAAGLEPLFIDLRGADWVEADLYRPAATARRFENWEFPYALLLGLGEAARYASAVGVEAAARRSLALASRLRRELAAIDGVRVLDRGRELCAIVTLAARGRAPEELVSELLRRGINSGAAGRSSAVLDFDAKGVSGALRLSPHYYNTEDEIAAAAAALAEVLSPASR